VQRCPYFFCQDLLGIWWNVVNLFQVFDQSLFSMDALILMDIKNQQTSIPFISFLLPIISRRDDFLQSFFWLCHCLNFKRILSFNSHWNKMFWLLSFVQHELCSYLVLHKALSFPLQHNYLSSCFTYNFRIFKFFIVIS
jgi:hypothetical protein